MKYLWTFEIEGVMNNELLVKATKDKTIKVTLFVSFLFLSQSFFSFIIAEQFIFLSLFYMLLWKIREINIDIC
jgi:hypothetical protein